MRKEKYVSRLLGPVAGCSNAEFGNCRGANTFSISDLNRENKDCLG